MLKRIGLFLIISSLSLSANAALIEIDLFNDGDGLLTRDTVNNIEWLDLTASTNLDWGDILSGAGGWIDLGFRYAEQHDLRGLYLAAGLTPSNGANAPDAGPVAYENGNRLQGLLGITSSYTISNGFNTSTSGNMAPSIHGNPWTLLAVAHDVKEVSAYLTLGLDGSGRGDNRGNWLIRDVSPTPVPVPASAWLLVSALITLVGFRRKR